jgi:hypothetical protein
MAARLEARRNFVSNRVVDSWNQTPSQVKNVKTVSSFKHGHKTTKPDWKLPHKGV